jgi:hypothetical protein
MAELTPVPNPEMPQISNTDDLRNLYEASDTISIPVSKGSVQDVQRILSERPLTTEPESLVEGRQDTPPSHPQAVDAVQRTDSRAPGFPGTFRERIASAFIAKRGESGSASSNTIQERNNNKDRARTKMVEGKYRAKLAVDRSESAAKNIKYLNAMSKTMSREADLASRKLQEEWSTWKEQLPEEIEFPTLDEEVYDPFDLKAIWSTWKRPESIEPPMSDNRFDSLLNLKKQLSSQIIQFEKQSQRALFHLQASRDIFAGSLEDIKIARRHLDESLALRNSWTVADLHTKTTFSSLKIYDYLQSIYASAARLIDTRETLLKLHDEMSGFAHAELSRLPSFDEPPAYDAPVNDPPPAYDNEPPTY